MQREIFSTVEPNDCILGNEIELWIIIETSFSKWVITKWAPVGQRNIRDKTCLKQETNHLIFF